MVAAMDCAASDPSCDTSSILIFYYFLQETKESNATSEYDDLDRGRVVV